MAMETCACAITGASFTPSPTIATIEPACELRGVLGRALSAFFEVLDRRTLADLLRPQAQLIRIFRGAGARPSLKS